MTVHKLTNTQKSYKPKTIEDYITTAEEMKLRMVSIEQTLNLILKKLDM
tara:strand:- start:41 stop:187 length:147 start_codon:yes stop_codon:yes gene_type:complete